MKLENLKNELIEKLSNEAKRAGSWCWYYKYKVQMDSHYQAWANYRLWVMQNRRTIADMSLDQFRFAVHSNWMNIQSSIFGTSQN